MGQFDANPVRRGVGVGAPQVVVGPCCECLRLFKVMVTSKEEY